MHPADAAELGVGDGDIVTLGNARGSLRLHVKLNAAGARGVIVSEGLWDNRDFLDGRGINTLTGDDSVAPFGGAAFHDAKRLGEGGGEGRDARGRGGGVSEGEKASSGCAARALPRPAFEALAAARGGAKLICSVVLVALAIRARVRVEGNPCRLPIGRRLPALCPCVRLAAPGSARRLRARRSAQRPA